MSGHVRAPQIGGKSMLLSQIGCTSPFTQRQTQRASAEAMEATTKQTAKIPDGHGIAPVVRNFMRALLQDASLYHSYRYRLRESPQRTQRYQQPISAVQ